MLTINPWAAVLRNSLQGNQNLQKVLLDMMSLFLKMKLLTQKCKIIYNHQIFL